MNLWLLFIKITSRLLSGLGLRGEHGHWGVVYDSVTKQPIDPAIVKLVEVHSGRVIQTSFTDIRGHYGFLSMPGRFKIFVRKTNYQFPTHRLEGDHDGIYKNLYRGEFFDLVGGTDVVALNIPMDPINPDWNQQAKQRAHGTSPALEFLARKLVQILFWGGLIFAGLKYYKTQDSAFLPILYAYGAVLLLHFLLPTPRLWGRVRGGKTGQLLEDILIELSHPDIPGIVVGKAYSMEDGKFYLRVPPGNYLLEFKKNNQLYASKKISVGSESVVTGEFKI